MFHRKLLFGAVFLFIAGVLLNLLLAEEAPVPEKAEFPASVLAPKQEAANEEENRMEGRADEVFFSEEGKEESKREIRQGPVRAELRAPSQEYVVWVPEESSAYDLMIIAQEHSEFDFGGKNFWGLGFFVEEINGVAQNPKEDMYWIYYINGETALVGVSQYEIQSNDIIEWKYETQN